MSCVTLLHLLFLEKQFPGDSHVIYQTYCISGHAASLKQMASAGPWQEIERRGAYCNCQARSLESHSFLLHWSQSLYTCSPSSPLSNFSCKTDGEIWGRCEKGKLLSFTHKPQLYTWGENWSKSTTSKKLFWAFPLNTAIVDAWQIWWGHSTTAGHLPAHAGLWLWALGLPKVRAENTVSSP